MMIPSDGFEVCPRRRQPDGCIGLVQSRFIRLPILRERRSGERHHQGEPKKAGWSGISWVGIVTMFRGAMKISLKSMPVALEASRKLV